LGSDAWDLRVVCYRVNELTKIFAISGKANLGNVLDADIKAREHQ
jgi:hypothetical protein